MSTRENAREHLHNHYGREPSEEEVDALMERYEYLVGLLIPHAERLAERMFPTSEKES